FPSGDQPCHTDCDCDVTRRGTPPPIRTTQMFIPRMCDSSVIASCLPSGEMPWKPFDSPRKPVSIDFGSPPATGTLSIRPSCVKTSDSPFGVQFGTPNCEDET